MITLAAALVCFAIVVTFWEELLCLLMFFVTLTVAGGLLMGMAFVLLHHGLH